VTPAAGTTASCGAPPEGWRLTRVKLSVVWINGRDLPGA
jgi:hypothetical protein